MSDDRHATAALAPQPAGDLHAAELTVRIIPSTPKRAPDYRDAWGGGSLAELQAWRARGAELEHAVTAMATVLNNKEWAEHVSGDPAIVALETEITKLVDWINARHAAAELVAAATSAQDAQIAMLREALEAAHEALESIALAGMSGTGMESEEGMRDWHARRAWEFIGIAARSLDGPRAALAATGEQT